MGPRIRGAVLAFAAAALLAGAALLPWWSGPPIRYGQPVESMSVEVTLLGFHGCRGVGGAEVSCITYDHLEKNETWLAKPVFAGAAFAALGLAALSALILIVQGIMAQLGRFAAARKLAVVVIATAALAAIAGGVILATAPDTHGVPRGLGTWFAFGGAVLAIVQAVIARLPQRERPVVVAEQRLQPPKPMKQPKPPKPAKPPKQPKPPKAAKPPKQPKQGPMPAAPSLLGGNYQGSPSPMDFLALMEGGGNANQHEPPAWEQHTLEAPGSSLPGPGSVLGTSMPPPNFSPMGAQRPLPSAPPPMPATSDALAQTMVPRPPPGLGMPARPPPPMYAPMAPTAPPTAPTQAINVGSRAGLPSEPVVMTMGPSGPPTVIPVPNLFGGAAGAVLPPERNAPPPPPFRSGKTLPPPLFGKPSPPPPMPMPMPSPVPARDERASTDLSSADGDDDLDSAATIEAGADRTDATGAVPEAGSDPNDTGPLAEPPPPDDLDDRPDTASDVAETMERSPEEAAKARIGIKPLFGDLMPRIVPITEEHDETLPRPRESSTAIASPAAMAKAGTPPPGLAHAATQPAASAMLPPTRLTPAPMATQPAAAAPPPAPPPPRAKPTTLPPPTPPAPPPPRAKPTTIPPISAAAKGASIPQIPKPASIPPPLGRVVPLPSFGKPLTTPPPLGALPPLTPPPPPRPPVTPPPPAPPADPPMPMTTAAPDLPPPTDSQITAGGPAPACPQCDSPMSWVEKHLRFYCAGCRMYF